MYIIIPAYVSSNSNLDLIVDQILVTIESYYRYNNYGEFIIFTNSTMLSDYITLFNKVYEKNVKVEIIDFNKEWDNTGLQINDVRTRKNFIISKMVIPFIFHGDYLLMDWDILTTGYIDPDTIKSDKLRFFNAKNYDGVTLRQISVWKGLNPDAENIGRHRWVNSGYGYFPKDLSKQLILEYWEKYDKVIEQNYRNIFLFDIIGDELIYNLMLIDEDKNVEECTKYNINVVLRNFYFGFNDIPSMYSFGSCFPYLLNVHFAVGHVKPFDVIVDEHNTLSYTIKMENYAIGRDAIKWLFDVDQHRMGSYHYNALIFSLIWQHTRYSIREKLGLSKENISKRYLDFFNNNIVTK